MKYFVIIILSVVLISSMLSFIDKKYIRDIDYDYKTYEDEESTTYISRGLEHLNSYKYKRDEKVLYIDIYKDRESGELYLSYSDYWLSHLSKEKYILINNHY